jgi:hypothetical protein
VTSGNAKIKRLWISPAYTPDTVIPLAVLLTGSNRNGASTDGSP